MANHSNAMQRSIHIFLCWWVGLLMLGCSDEATLSESTRAEQSDLTFPVTITLSTPNPVAPTAPVLNGSSSVSLGARAEVVSGMTVSMGSAGLQTQPDALLNETWSRGTAVLRDRVRVRGTLHARTRTNGSSVAVTTWDQNPAFDPAQTLSWKVDYPAGPAADLTLNSGVSAPLAPGKHGNVTLNSQSTLTLQTGTYYLTSLIMQSASTVRLEQASGPVVIYVTNGLTLRGTFVPVTGTAPDLLVAHLGTTPVIVETPFNGALLAPFTSLTFRSLATAHTGFFFAKNTVLDAGAKVTYRRPLAVIGAAGKSGGKCLELVAAGVPPTELFKYCDGCDVPIDSDVDGIEDCAEDCDFDANKTVPLICGCGVPETDTDSDGTPDCIDPCDLDPANTAPGQCGCTSSNPSVRPPRPAGTKCTDTAGPVSGTATCNGSGVCGNPGPSNPGGCRLVNNERSAYWFCPGPATQNAAAAACRARGMALVRIDGFTENSFLQRRVTKPTWIGANSITTSGNWRWSVPANNNGDQFWAGAANGQQQNALFSFWAAGSPATQRCAVIRAGNARWQDVDCNQALGFVCEFHAPASPQPTLDDLVPPSGDPGQPVAPIPDATCITSSQAFLLPEHVVPDPNGIDEFVPFQTNAEAGIFEGPAQMQPPRNQPQTCIAPVGEDRAAGIGVPSEGYGCQFTPIANEPAGFICLTDEDCDPLGPNLSCRQVQDQPGCLPRNGVLCTGKPHCGTMLCPPQPAGVETCQTFDVCDPGSTFTPDDNGTDLVPEQFDPGSMFPGGQVPNVQPSASYQDDPDQLGGKAHKWCFMDAQNDIGPADKGQDQKVGQANGGSKLSFKFDPNLTFQADVNPLSLGETDLRVLAKAELATHVKLTDFIGATFDRKVLSAVAELEAHRCTVRSDNTEFAVFGVDFLDIDQVPQFNTSDRNRSTIGGKDFFDATHRCNVAVGKALTAINRAKKAFRDVQQLIEQFKTFKLDGKNLANLCRTVLTPLEEAGVTIPGFPDGLSCPAGEPTEVTINRFLDYYQAPGFGAISGMREAIGELRSATDALFAGLNQRFEFGPEPKGESRTLVEAQFQIGPVPCLLEISAFYSYGVNGYFELAFKPPFNPFADPPEDGQPQKNEVAKVRAGVMPYASAGLSAFVGAGKRLGPFSASLGIEGSVRLASIRAPIFAGAGLGAEVQVDNRSLAPDIATVLGAATGIPTHLGVPKSFKFFVWYEYGAMLEAADILRGEVNGRLRIKFAFFSRTWKKRLVKFNGLRPITVHLVSGKAGNDPAVNEKPGEVQYEDRDGNPATATTKVVEGTTDMGLSEPQVPLLVLEPLEEDSGIEAVDPPNPEEFQSGKVQGMFYDNLCCAKLTDSAPAGTDVCLISGNRPVRGGPVPCCAGSRCAIIIDLGTRCVVDAECQPNDGYCNTTADCCDETAMCSNHRCTVGGGDCAPEGSACSENTACCNQAECSPPGGPANTCFTCPTTNGGPCQTDEDCCGGPGGGPLKCMFFEEVGNVCNDPG
jgi:hypothetical protein